MKEVKTSLRGFLSLFIYLVSSVFFIYILSVFGIDYFKLSNNLQELSELIFEIILMFIIIYIYKDTFIPDLKEFWKNKKEYLDKYFKYWILLLVLMFTSNYLISMFTSQEIANNQKVINETFVSFPIYSLILTILVAPILEELVFRLSFRKIFYRTDFLFIFFSGFIFGLMHVLGETTLSGLLYIIPYSIPGYIFAYLYLKSKNICVPISIHMIHNTALMILQIIALL